MTNEALKIFVDQLKQGKVEKIDRSVPSDFLQVEEPDLSFESDISIQGEIYIAGDGLVCHLNVGATGVIPCSICNEPVEVPIRVKGLYHVEPLEKIRTGIFNLSDVIRENILLETPTFAECQNGSCPQRNVIGKYLKKDDADHQIDSEEEGYHPFADLT